MSSASHSTMRCLITSEAASPASFQPSKAASITGSEPSGWPPIKESKISSCSLDIVSSLDSIRSRALYGNHVLKENPCQKLQQLFCGTWTEPSLIPSRPGLPQSKNWSPCTGADTGGKRTVCSSLGRHYRGSQRFCESAVRSVLRFRKS